MRAHRRDDGAEPFPTVATTGPALRFALAHVVFGAVLALGCAADAAAQREQAVPVSKGPAVVGEPGSVTAVFIRAANQARLLVAQADWDYSGTITAADSDFTGPGSVTRAQTLVRAARRAGIGGSDGLDDAEVRRFVTLLAGADQLLDYMEQIALLRALRREQGDMELQLPERPPRTTLSMASGVRMLRYRGDVSGDGLITSHDDSRSDPARTSEPTFAVGLRKYASRHRIGDGRRLGEAELAKILRRFTGSDDELSPSERARLDRTIRPA